MQRLFRQFSFPGGVPSHVAPETPGSIHEGGELGYALSHAFGAAFDNPDLLVACVVGDGEAETGPLATSWHSNKFLDPGRDGAVLPVLHLNGWKIANPAVLARIPERELLSSRVMAGLRAWSRGRSRRPSTRSSRPPSIWRSTRSPRSRRRPAERRDGPAALANADSADAEGLDGATRGGQEAGRGHLAFPPGAAHARSRRPGAPSSAGGVAPETADPRSSSTSEARSSPSCRRWRRTASAGWAPTRTPTAASSCVTCCSPTSVSTQCRSPSRARARVSRRASRPLPPRRRRGEPRHVPHLRARRDGLQPARRGLRGDRQDLGGGHASTRRDARAGRTRHGGAVEHQCQGWLEGYLLTGRHGLFNCYEAFIHIIDAMFNQHAKWLKVTRGSRGAGRWRR